MTNDDVMFWQREEPAVTNRIGALMDWAGAWAAAYLALVASLWAYAVTQAYYAWGDVDWSGLLTVEPERKRVRTIAAALGGPKPVSERLAVLFEEADRPLRVAAHVVSWAEIEARALAARAEVTADRWLAEIELELAGSSPSP